MRPIMTNPKGATFDFRQLLVPAKPTQPTSHVPKHMVALRCLDESMYSHVIGFKLLFNML